MIQQHRRFEAANENPVANQMDQLAKAFAIALTAAHQAVLQNSKQKTRHCKPGF